MMLEEANARLKKAQITEEQLHVLNSLDILLDLDKDDIFRIVYAVGLDVLLKRQLHYDRLDRAEQEFRAKERYLKSKTRLKDLLNEKL